MPNADSATQVLFQPLRLSGVEIKNRIVMGPMAVLQPQQDGRPSEQTTAFLVERAKGGVGLIIVGGGAGTQRMYDEGPYHPLLRLDLDEYVPDLKRLTDAVHAHSTVIFSEVMGGFGRMGKPGPGRPTIAASPRGVTMRPDRFLPGVRIPADRVLPPPQEATIEEIRASEQGTIDAALRMRRAGFDGVEIAAHMSYFHSSFLSPRTNWRTDEYGGNPENRARVLVNIVRGIRARVGPDYPVGLRMSVNEHVDDGQGPKGFAEIAAIVAREGLTYLALTDGNYEAMHVNAPAADGMMLEHGEPQVFREALGELPLFLGNINDPAATAAAIEAGHGDAVMLARQLLADPQYPNKVRDGHAGDVTWCVRDNACMRRLLLNMPVRCHENPRMGRESRAAGSLPPLDRILRRPVEEIVLKVTSSDRLMDVAARLAAK
jgi:2,4-dienoyl-CoA reductase (NADPH2)